MVCLHNDSIFPCKKSVLTVILSRCINITNNFLILFLYGDYELKKFLMEFCIKTGSQCFLRTGYVYFVFIKFFQCF